METPGFQRELMTLGAHGPPEIAAKTIRVGVGKRMFSRDRIQSFHQPTDSSCLSSRDVRWCWPTCTASLKGQGVDTLERGKGVAR